MRQVLLLYLQIQITEVAVSLSNWPKDAQLVSVKSLDLNLGLSGSKKAAEA